MMRDSKKKGKKTRRPKMKLGLKGTGVPVQVKTLSFGTKRFRACAGIFHSDRHGLLCELSRRVGSPAETEGASDGTRCR